MTARFLPFVVLVALASPAAAAKWAITESWGKPGVTFEQYRADSVACTEQGYYLDVSKTDEAKAFVTASKQLDSLQGATQMQVPPGNPDPLAGPTVDAATDAVSLARNQESIIRSIDPDSKIKTLKQKMQTPVDRCLAAHGYRKFRLTAAQTKRLGKMKVGSAARHQYLYSLASDAAIVSAQAEDAAPKAQ
jgi:hypothetical protein